LPTVENECYPINGAEKLKSNIKTGWDFPYTPHRHEFQSQAQWLTSVILATQEAEIRGSLCK
jgi:hypothetical protein